ncbi:hypothetical protein [Trinickia mobilis]|uniref:hypothetical protein n=1 Tax=Trinickia mobilis TaxID=2816356 RepID=UPI001A8DA66D|nr:hypothetical protein [Trinickia mobilis]
MLDFPAAQDRFLRHVLDKLQAPDYALQHAFGLLVTRARSADAFVFVLAGRQRVLRQSAGRSCVKKQSYDVDIRLTLNVLPLDWQMGEAEISSSAREWSDGFLSGRQFVEHRVSGWETPKAQRRQGYPPFSRLIFP